MCRWLAYSGSPVPLDTFLLQPEHSLIDQSLHARMGAQTTNGDGFGVGWYGDDAEPGVYSSIAPAWNDRNLRGLAAHVRSGLFLAHIRASTGTAIQQTNCHPFRHDRWLWMHNGLIRDFSTIKRDLTLAVDPDLFESIEGSTDSEVMFYLALTFGLAKDPIGAVERMVGVVEKTADVHGIENPMRMSISASNGEQLWVFRYSTEQDSPSLFYTSDMRTLRQLYPDSPRLEGVSDESRLIVSEPLTDLPGVWNEIPEASCGIVQAGRFDVRPFVPQR